MKQILQDFRTGQLDVHDVPVPLLRPGGVIVRTHHSLISSGTEGETVRLARRNLLEKARSRPDLVRKVLNVARTDGLMSAYEAVMNNLDAPVPLGYSLAGEVVEVGRYVDDLQIGDRVACFGSMIANHAEANFIPRNLCVRLPESVDTRRAAFCMLGAIALNGLRRAEVELGSRVLVIGLGLIGQITTQLLKAAGCRVIGVDLDAGKLRMAEASGADRTLLRSQANIEEIVLAESDGMGVDATIITAAASSADPIELAGRVTRQRGRVVALGRVPYELPRDEYLFKEIEFVTTFAFGPGVNDPTYELQGVDYPPAHVRWSGKRNVEAFVQLLAENRLPLEPLITHEFDIGEAKQAYDLMSGGSESPVVAVLLRYPIEASYQREPVVIQAQAPALTSSGRPGIGVIGAGSHAVSFMLEAICAQDVEQRGILSLGGFKGKWYGEKFGFAYAASDVEQLLEDEQIRAVFVLSRHDSHAELTARALEFGKDVFVEKPLCLTVEALDRVRAAHAATGGRVMVGYNRRYAALGVKLQQYFANRAQPLAIVYRMNAGARPASHWLHDPDVGGGLILGEGIHFLDFMQFLVADDPISVTARSLHGPSHDIIDCDTVTVTVGYADGSLGTLHYFSNGDKGVGRERIEVHCDNSTAVLEDWRSLVFSKGGKRQRTSHRIRQQKGFAQEIAAFIEAVKTGQELPMSFADVDLGMRTALGAIESLRTGKPILLQDVST